MDAAALRAEFPVLERLAFLNAGTDGPLPARALAAGQAELETQVRDGRPPSYFDRRSGLTGAQRAAYARRLGCDPASVALTASTSEGVARFVSGLRLGRGDEVLTSDAEHPGLLGSLLAARELRSVAIRTAPLADLPDAVGPRTRLVACSHVSWVTGALAPRALGDLDVPVLLDGAQGVGAVPVDVRALGCAAYAASGQKWLCGPDGTGMLYVAPEVADQVAATAPAYLSFRTPYDGLAATLHDDARRHDTAALSAEASAMALAALDVLGETGWEAVHERARDLAALLAEQLRACGHDVAPRDETTLVSWGCADAETVRDRLRDAGVIVRDMPGRGLLRASIGAWNDESDLERLLSELR